MTDCSCNQCVLACRVCPGWFLPGEAQKAAELLRMPFEDFRRFLIRDYWCGTPDGPGNGHDIFVLTPRKIGVDDDRETASFAYAFRSGTCVFLEKGKCTIHAAKPSECRKNYGCRGKAGVVLRRKAIARAWYESGERP